MSKLDDKFYKLNFQSYLWRWGEVCVWYVYLFSLIWISLLSTNIESENWHRLLMFFFSFLGVYSLLLAINNRVQLRAIKEAKWLIILCCASVFWLWLQQLLPGSYRYMGAAQLAVDSPAWFSPITKLSIVPTKTNWLMITELFVVSLMVFSIVLIDSRKRLKQMLFTLVLVGATHASLAIWAYFENTHLVDVKQLDGHFKVARGIFINRNHLAAFLVVCLAGNCALFFKNAASAPLKPVSSRIRLLIVGFGALAMISITAIFMSQSRGGVLSLILASLVLLVIGLRRNAKFKFRLSYFLGILIVGIAMMFVFGPALVERFIDEGASLGERTVQWRITLGAIFDAPLLGFGGGSYGTVFQIYRQDESLRQVIYNQAHNQFLHLWLEQGLIGLLLWLAVLSLTFRRIYESISRGKSSLIVGVNLACLLVILAALLQSLVDFNLQIVNIRAYFFVIIAIVFASPYIRQRIVR